MLNGGYSGGEGAGDGGFRRQEERMQGARNEYQDEDPAKQRNDQELAEQRRMLQSEETAKANAEWWEVACYVQGAPRDAGY